MQLCEHLRNQFSLWQNMDRTIRIYTLVLSLLLASIHTTARYANLAMETYPNSENLIPLFFVLHPYMISIEILHTNNEDNRVKEQTLVRFRQMNSKFQNHDVYDGVEFSLPLSSFLGSTCDGYSNCVRSMIGATLNVLKELQFLPRQASNHPWELKLSVRAGDKDLWMSQQFKLPDLSAEEILLQSDWYSLS